MHKYSTEIALINLLAMAMAMASKHRIIETQVTTVTERITNLKSWQLYAYCLDTVSGAKTYSHTITAASEVNLRAAGTHNSHNVSLSVLCAVQMDTGLGKTRHRRALTRLVYNTFAISVLTYFSRITSNSRPTLVKPPDGAAMFARACQSTMWRHFMAVVLATG